MQGSPTSLNTKPTSEKHFTCWLPWGPFFEYIFTEVLTQSDADWQLLQGSATWLQSHKGHLACFVGFLYIVYYCSVGN